jgi:hypothetical protein
MFDINHDIRNFKYHIINPNHDIIKTFDSQDILSIDLNNNQKTLKISYTDCTKEEYILFNNNMCLTKFNNCNKKTQNIIQKIKIEEDRLYIIFLDGDVTDCPTGGRKVFKFESKNKYFAKYGIESISFDYKYNRIYNVHIKYSYECDDESYGVDDELFTYPIHK